MSDDILLEIAMTIAIPHSDVKGGSIIFTIGCDEAGHFMLLTTDGKAHKKVYHHSYEQTDDEAIQLGLRTICKILQDVYAV